LALGSWFLALGSWFLAPYRHCAAALVNADDSRTKRFPAFFGWLINDAAV
jgi:hypothetical protein